MKLKTKIKKKHLVRLMKINTLFAILLIIGNIILTATGINASYAGVGDALADFGGGALSGIASVLALFLKFIVWFIAEALYAIIKGVTQQEGGLEGILFAGSGSAAIKDVPILSIEFFNFEPTGMGAEAAKVFRESVAKWYYIIRLIAVSALLLILIYVGIRMALSTIASDQAKYKKMLTDWATSMALIFLLHYIIVITISANASIVQALSGLVDTKLGDNNDQTVGMYFIDTLQNEIKGVTENVKGLFCAAILCVYMGETLIFLIYYIKRMVTTGFLIMISPLITITYSIDKMGDGKAQALNAWLKEFVFNILIQPFHCILYASFFGAVADLMKNDDVGIMGYVLAIFLAIFIHKAEDILRKIFNFQTQSMGSVVSNAQGFMNATGTFAKGAAAITTGGIAMARGVGGMMSSGAKAINNGMTNRAVKKSDAFKDWKNKEGTSGKLSDFLDTKEGKAAKEAAWKESKRYRVQQGISRATFGLVGGTTAHRDAKIRADMKNQTYSYDGNTNMSYDETKEAARQGSVEAQAALAEQEKKSRKEYKPPKIRGAVGRVGDAVTRFKESDFGKASGVVAKHLITTGVAIGTGAVGAGMSGNFQGAITGGQLGYGAASGLLTSTTRTAKKETTGVAEKVLAMSGKSKEEFEDYAEEIYQNGKYGHKYDGMNDKFDDFAEKFRKNTGCSEAEAERLNTEIKLGLAKDQYFDVEGLIRSYMKNLKISDETKQKQVDSGKELAQIYGESMIYSQMENAEDNLGIDHTEYIQQVTKKISNYRIEQNQTINVNSQTNVDQTSQNGGSGTNGASQSASSGSQRAHDDANREADRKAENAANKASREGDQEAEKAKNRFQDNDV